MAAGVELGVWREYKLTVIILVLLTTTHLTTCVIPSIPADCQDTGPVISTDSISWCRISAYQCGEFCNGQQSSTGAPYVHTAGGTCVCAASDVTHDVSVSRGCGQLYFNYHMFVSGTYIIQGNTPVICDIEGREICNGSLVHGASGLVQHATDACTNVATPTLAQSNTLLNTLSPYTIDAPHVLCSSGEFTIVFRQQVLVQAMYISSDTITSVTLTYTFNSDDMTTWTNTNTYQYKEEVYGDASTITVTSGFYQDLRPFVADSVTLTVPAGSGSLKFDLLGCKFDASQEISTHPSFSGSPWSCYYWPTPASGSLVHESTYFDSATAMTGTHLATYLKLEECMYWGLPQHMPLGKAPDGVTCPDTTTCVLLQAVAGTTSTVQCGREVEYEAAVTTAFANVVAGKPQDNCTFDAKAAFDSMKKTLMNQYHKTCPTATAALYLINYNQYQTSFDLCVTVTGSSDETIESVPASFSGCESGGTSGGTYLAPLFRNRFFECDITYPSVLATQHGVIFYEINSNMDGVNRRTVGHISTSACGCPHTTMGQTLNEQEFICAPDFTYFQGSYLGCEMITCKEPPSPAPGNATRTWDDATEKGTIITYTCDTDFLFETSNWPESITSECSCEATWTYQNDITLPICKPTCPDVSTTLPAGLTFDYTSHYPYIEGTEFQYSCQATNGTGQFEDGLSQHPITCQSDHTWLPLLEDLPRCVKLVTLASAPDVTDATKIESLECKMYIDDGTMMVAPSVTYECIGIFEGLDNNTFSYTSTDCTWDNLNVPVCLDTTTSTTTTTTTTPTTTTSTTTTTTTPTPTTTTTTTTTTSTPEPTITTTPKPTTTTTPPPPPPSTTTTTPPPPPTTTTTTITTTPPPPPPPPRTTTMHPSPGDTGSNPWGGR